MVDSVVSDVDDNGQIHVGERRQPPGETRTTHPA